MNRSSEKRVSAFLTVVLVAAIVAMFYGQMMEIQGACVGTTNKSQGSLPQPQSHP
jgi:hypothetical protein